jgi:predicted nucleic acid-binding protein
VTALAFDSTALSHFAQADRLAELEAITAADECVVPAEVLTELTRGVAAHPALGTVSAQAWLHSVELDEFAELVAFAKHKGELGGGPGRNNGEAAVLAWVVSHGGIAIIDEAVATNIGDRDGIPVQGSLWLVICGYKNGVLDRATAEGIMDDLISTGMWLPVASGAEFFAWAYSKGWLP